MSGPLLSGIRLAVIASAGIWLLATRVLPSFIVTLCGLTLLAILFGFENREERRIGPRLAFGLTGGLAAMLALTPILNAVPVISTNFPSAAEVWVTAALIIFLVEQMRAPAVPPIPRLQRSEPVVVNRTGFAPPRLVREEPAPAYTPSPSPASAAPPVTVQPEVTPAPEPQSPSTVRSAAAPPPPPPTAPSPQTATPAGAPIRRGKPVDIYVNLMGEGMTMLRTVHAEHIGKDFYHIIDEMPSNERWEFKPGQVVRCQKKSLSHGKGLVAVAEAPRAQ